MREHSRCWRRTAIRTRPLKKGSRRRKWRRQRSDPQRELKENAHVGSSPARRGDHRRCGGRSPGSRQLPSPPRECPRLHRLLLDRRWPGPDGFAQRVRGLGGRRPLGRGRARMDRRDRAQPLPQPAAGHGGRSGGERHESDRAGRLAASSRGGAEEGAGCEPEQDEEAAVRQRLQRLARNIRRNGRGGDERPGRRLHDRDS